MTAKSDKRQLLSPRQVAGLLAVSTRTVKRMIGRGELVPCNLGYNMVRIPAHQIDRLIKERTPA